tara:strand:+ start:1560 stop:2255 length:696 start_codon:yes stop_codon:yes gene_type:complete
LNRNHPLNEQKIKTQIAREYYNVIYGAKLHFASFDLCEKLPTFISVISLTFGVLGLAFSEFNSQSLGAILLIIGIIGISLKPRELQKDEYKATGDKLNQVGKRLENLYCEIEEKDKDSVAKARAELSQLQKEHHDIGTMAPVLLSSWYAHYKLFSEHNSDWMCRELELGFFDKVPLSLRITIICLILLTVLFLNPFCLTTDLLNRVTSSSEQCCKEEAVTAPSLKSTKNTN